MVLQQPRQRRIVVCPEILLAAPCTWLGKELLGHMNAAIPELKETHTVVNGSFWGLCGRLRPLGSIVLLRKSLHCVPSHLRRRGDAPALPNSPSYPNKQLFHQALALLIDILSNCASSVPFGQPAALSSDMATPAGQSTAHELEQTLSKYKGIVSKLKNALQSARADAARAREEAAAQASMRSSSPAGASAAEGSFSIDALQACQETIAIRPVCIVHLGPAGTPATAHGAPPASTAEERWVLAEAWSGTPPSTPLAGPAQVVSADPAAPTGTLLTRGWVLLGRLEAYLSPGQELPAAHLPPHTTASMQEQVQTANARLAACEEAFRRFRVQAATSARRLQEQVEAAKGVQGGEPAEPRSRSGTGASHDSAGGGAASLRPPHAAGSNAALADVKAELRLVRGELSRALAANGDSTARAAAAEEALRAARTRLGTAEDATEAWKLRCLEAEAALGGEGGGGAATPASSRSAGGAQGGGGGGGYRPRCPAGEAAA